MEYDSKELFCFLGNKPYRDTLKHIDWPLWKYLIIPAKSSDLLWKSIKHSEFIRIAWNRINSSSVYLQSSFIVYIHSYRSLQRNLLRKLSADVFKKYQDLKNL